MSLYGRRKTMEEKLKTYRIQNQVTKEWWKGKAYSAPEACCAAGWQIGNCYIKVRTPRYGWGKPKEK